MANVSSRSSERGSLSLAEVASDLGVSYELARQMCAMAEDPIPHFRAKPIPGARWIIPKDAYEAWKKRRLNSENQGQGVVR